MTLLCAMRNNSVGVRPLRPFGPPPLQGGGVLETVLNLSCDDLGRNSKLFLMFHRIKQQDKISIFNLFFNSRYSPFEACMD